jgi:uncharacterized protein DUF397
MFSTAGTSVSAAGRVESAGQAPSVWRKSTRSGANGNCIEVLFTVDTVGVRDSKDPAGPVLQFAGHFWRHFIQSVRDGSLATEQI